MNELTGKIILLISPQAWGNMFISKHHYAIELAKRGNQVYFLNPPGENRRNVPVRIKLSGIHENLWLIDHDLFFPYNLKFHALFLFHFLMSWQVKKVLRQIGHRVDIVWSFDIGNLYPFRLFPSYMYKIFHPVDEPLLKYSIKAAEGADIIFSVTREILDKYTHLPVEKHFINHGLSGTFLALTDAMDKRGIEQRVGFSGNLLRPDIDRETIFRIVKENPAIRFDFWGSYRNVHSNIGAGEDQDQQLFIENLETLPNVYLHGPVTVAELATNFACMDAFLICYDIQRDQSKGTNYHKVMEFLASGKVIISNNITTYKDRPDLIVMPVERDSNSSMPALFKEVMNNLEFYNATEKINARINFAKENSYARQLDRIEKLVNMEPLNSYKIKQKIKT